MKFTRLRLTGFKSFAEPTDVPIEPGLTGVVGPNGCGKSNIADALLFVMGESSYKAMRGAGMEDVIFAGSGARPGRNAAEVVLTLDNTDRTAPAGFNDSDLIEISRRIERESGSSYRFNGREVRARDVQLLFADASAGSRSPAMVSQGRVGSLITAKPEARRAILEEAAGISGLFGRRQEAETRLKAAEQNLERLEDVLAEIDRQLETLRRQARQAVRYRNLSAEIRKSEAAALTVRYAAATASVTAAEAELARAVATVAERGAIDAMASAAQAKAAAALPELRDAAAAAAAALQRVRTEDERIAAEERTVAARIADLDRRRTQFAADLERERRLAAENAAVMARLDAERERLAAEEAATIGRRTEAAQRVAAAEGVLAEDERLAGDAQATLAELKARRGQAERDLNDARQRARRHADDAARIDRDRAALANAPSAVRLEAAREKVSALEEQLAVSEQAAIAADAAADEARSVEAAARTAMTEAESAFARVDAEAKALRSVLPRTEVENPIVDLVTARDGAEAAVAAVFGDELSLSEDEARPAHWRSLPAGDPAPLPAGARPMGEFVDAPPVLARRLAQTGVVERADGARLQPMLHPGQTLTSLEGDLWRWDGLVVAAGARRAEADRLAARKRLRDLTAKLADLKPSVTATGEALRVAREGLQRAIGAASTERTTWRTLQRDLDAARNAMATAQREQAAADARLSALAEAGSRVAASIAEAAAAEAKATEALQKLPPAESLEKPIADLRAKVGAGRSAVTEARTALAGIDRDSQHRQSRLRSIADEKAAWALREKNAGAQIATLAQREAEAGAEREVLAGQPASLAARRAALAAAAAEAEAERAAAADRLAEAEEALAMSEKAARVAQADLAEAREIRGRSEERLGGARQRVTELAQRIAEALQCKPEDAAAAAGLKEGALPALDQVEARVERLKDERERLGGVNLNAEQEATELDGRRQSIIVERDDLVAAIQKLRQAIGSLNREGRERLLAAFHSVDEKFRELFTTLFGGGTAELKLTDAEDPLQAGLEIIARPPGKKPTTMTLLSGGEQALTALSLIFAVFLTKPAPICVLDEVDAPLDDANVERFCLLLEEITKRTDTRFLVTTHNPITMARMRRLYGVTMAERGVSQLVSVDLETAERYREAS
ncbi:MAG: AAA family ATPase [Bauldia sp.]|nr:AAA family ATPase [Bauldia sp.]